MAIQRLQIFCSYKKISCNHSQLIRIDLFQSLRRFHVFKYLTRNLILNIFVSIDRLKSINGAIKRFCWQIGMAKKPPLITWFAVNNLYPKTVAFNISKPQSLIRSNKGVWQCTPQLKKSGSI